jgi:hypothetical protein
MSNPRSSQVRSARYACGLLRPWDIDRGRRYGASHRRFRFEPPLGLAPPAA